MKNTSSKVLLQFYLLVTYVLLQFCWWAYMITNLNREAHDLKLKIEFYNYKNDDDLAIAQLQLDEKLHKRWLMIAGEGSVFALILGLGIYRTRSTFKKEFDLSNQQKNFMLSITHELKSPIAATRLQIETLIKHQLPQDKQALVLHQALQETERLDALVEKILLANRIESSAYFIQMESLDLSALCIEVVENLKITLLKNHEVTTFIEKPIFIKGDALAFTSILTNLLDNAAKYSPIKSKIEVILQKNNHLVSLFVKDEGIGISPKDEVEIFKKFYRSGSEETRNTKGTGLGLYIVKNLVKMHGGQIKISANQPKGSIFTIQLNGINKV
ncbi:MAG TPA: HAMP domain-containing sensor histidine kinase [Bacteroidia bacterium]|nr:HAMP domain-containing sensor histidine kinase [Bacteroidia bacterium]